MRLSAARLIVSWPRARGGWILRPLCTSWRRPWGLAPGWRQQGNLVAGGPLLWPSLLQASQGAASALPTFTDTPTLLCEWTSSS